MKLLLLAMAFGLAYSDVYFHNMRGSNNRLDESGREVSNNKRLFNSQNNNRGGYLAGNMYYYEGTTLGLEWTNQHSCNDPNNNCELIVQYTCGDLVRDGEIRTTIREHARQCLYSDCNTDLRFGMHENHQHFLKCRSRQRNQGLFTADQVLNGNSARYTRQNPKGTRYGYECPEERDYYPYWHPTEWKDIVVMTNDVSRCSYYQEQSENVKERFECYIPDDILKQYAHTGYLNGKLPNNKADCENFSFTPRRKPTVSGQWKEYQSHGIAAPECIQSPWSRDNHLGNGIGGQHNSFNWTIPKLDENCVLRIRYNISTNDFDSWNVDSNNNVNEDNPNGIDLSSTYGFSSPDEADQRGYVYENNPTVQIFPEVDFNLAINTAQFGRTFQDRSFVFTVKERPAELQGRTIHNVNVRGKRGNIVETYPSVEYDFVPNTLIAKVGDYVHFQWTGSNRNPGGNDGQGRAQTDRSNIVPLAPEIYREGSTFEWYQGLRTTSDWGRNYPGMLSNTSFLGFSFKDKVTLAVQHGSGDMSQLNDGSTYFDLEPKPITESGVFHYMSSRNNAFTNRCQKARVIVKS